MLHGPVRLLTLTALLFALLVTACGKETAPSGILSDEEMAPVLSDMQIAYAGIDHTIPNPREHNKRYDEMNQAILKKHGVEKEKFYESYQWYQARPEAMDSLFQQVLRILEKEMQDIQVQGQGAAAPQKMPVLK